MTVRVTDAAERLSRLLTFQLFGDEVVALELGILCFGPASSYLARRLIAALVWGISGGHILLDNRQSQRRTADFTAGCIIYAVYMVLVLVHLSKSVKVCHEARVEKFNEAFAALYDYSVDNYNEIQVLSALCNALDMNTPEQLTAHLRHQIDELRRKCENLRGDSHSLQRQVYILSQQIDAVRNQAPGKS